MNHKATLYMMSLILLLTSACTVFRDGGGDEGGTSGGGGSGGVEVVIGGNGGSQPDEEPVNVDVLVMLPLGQGGAVDQYPRLISQVISAMEVVFLIPRKIAIIPMYSRLGTEAPLLWGYNDPEAQFGTYQEALNFYSSDVGLDLFEDGEDHQDGQNLLELGARLGMRSIFHPNSPAEEGRYYFDEVPEGLVVLWINPFERRCNVSECQTSAGLLSSQLTARDEDGHAAWLSAAGGAGVPADRVFHLFIGTEETRDEEGFFDRCSGQAGFPSNILDDISPSRHELYAKLQDRLSDADIPNDEIDFCDALSTIQSPISHGIVATRIRSAMTR